MGYQNLTLHVELSFAWDYAIRNLNRLLRQLDERVQTGVPFLKSLRVCVHHGNRSSRISNYERSHFQKLLGELMKDRPAFRNAQFHETNWGDTTLFEAHDWTDNCNWMDHATFASALKTYYDGAYRGMKVK